MGHYYHNPISFWFEDLQTLTHKGKMGWERDPLEKNRFVGTLYTNSVILTLKISSASLVVCGERGIKDVEIVKAQHVDINEFEELFRSAVASALIRENKYLGKVIREVSVLVKKENDIDWDIDALPIVEVE